MEQRHTEYEAAFGKIESFLPRLNLQPHSPQPRNQSQHIVQSLQNAAGATAAPPHHHNSFIMINHQCKFITSTVTWEVPTATRKLGGRKSNHSTGIWRETGGARRMVPTDGRFFRNHIDNECKAEISICWVIYKRRSIGIVESEQA